MNKMFLIFILCFSLCFGATRTFTDAGDGLWSTVANWDGGATLPGNDDIVKIATGSTATLDIDTAPASGTFAEITNTGVTGTILVATGTRTINVTTVTCAGSEDVIDVTGSASLTINGNLVNTAVGTGDECVYFNSSGTLTIVGNVTGGSAGSSNCGIHLWHGSATCVVTGDITGGDGHITNYGIDINSTGTVTQSSGDVTGGAKAPAIDAGASGGAGALVIETLEFTDTLAAPLDGLFLTYSFTEITVNGTAVGGGTSTPTFESGSRNFD
jgi:hypothetical protein